MNQGGEIMLSEISHKPRIVGMALLASLVISFFLLVAFAWPAESVYAAHGLTAHHAQGAAGDAHGFTAGWLNGQTVQFFYTRDFFCEPPPSSGAPSQCEVGEDGEVDPRPGPIPTLYVMTPLGFRPDDSTLQCPEVGNCINHPSTIDLSRIGGPADAPLPAHSHIIEVMHGGWWEIEVIGVKSPAVWDQIVAGKSLATVRSLQASDPSGTNITGDIPTNLYLFFNVRP
jgi:hypothetical protein